MKWGGDDGERRRERWEGEDTEARDWRGGRSAFESQPTKKPRETGPPKKLRGTGGKAQLERGRRGGGEVETARDYEGAGAKRRAPRPPQGVCMFGQHWFALTFGSWESAGATPV